MCYIIAIAGPTASGKSKVAVELAKLIDAEIISVDVMQSYREMDIGTAKVTLEEQDGIKHHMINRYSIKDDVNASVYTEDVLRVIKELRKEKKNLILVGGSGLYMDSILYSAFEYQEIQIDQNYRDELYRISEKINGKETLYDMLLDIDPKYAEITHLNNVKRVIRALEFYHASGKKKSSVKKKNEYRFEKTYYFGLEVERHLLYQRINQRVDEMVDKGLIKEVDHILSYGFDQSLNALKAIGYRELIDVYDGLFTIDEAIEKIKQHSRNYAKRQYTWFRRNPDIIWFDTSQYHSLADIATEMERIINNGKRNYQEFD